MKRRILCAVVFAAIAIMGCDYGEPNGDGSAGEGDADRYLSEYYGRINGGGAAVAPSAYTLTADVSPIGGGSVSHPSQQSYPANAPVTVTATPYAGYTFTGWSGAPVGVDISGLSITFNINGNLALVANFQPIVVQSGFYALTVNAGNGGTVVPSGTSIHDSGAAIIVTATANPDHIFTGWTGAPQGVNAANESITFNINDNTVLTANFRPQIEGAVVPGTTLSGKLNYLDRSAESHKTYIVEVNGDETIAPYTFQYTGAINITVLLVGNGVNRTVKLSSHGRMFTVRNDVTLILGNNITLQGHSGNTGSMVYIYGGMFRMNSGSTITGNGETGVNLYSGTFEMAGGVISGNKTSTNGGGVYVSSYNTFTKTGGTITGYSSDQSNGNVVQDYSGVIARRGHAVYAYYYNDSNSKRKETTAGPELNLSVSGSTFGGVWDQ
jgi:uncharacterized repeat protein (TIGR02543 family)